MSSHLALPRKGHLQQLYHMVRYLSKCHNSEIVFDPSEPDIDHNQFQRKDWKATEFGEIAEILPPGASPARGFVLCEHSLMLIMLPPEDHGQVLWCT